MTIGQIYPVFTVFKSCSEGFILQYFTVIVHIMRLLDNKADLEYRKCKLA